MSDRDARLLAALAAVPADGTLEPSWESSARAGVVYRATGSDLKNEHLADELEELADGDYLERVFVERLSLCGSCGSHAVNFHEACMSCSSSNLVQFTALLHFRCGYVGPTTAFREERDGLRCPKCRRILNDVGTDYDSPGDYFRCRACAAMFQVPEVGARCLSCGARFAGEALQSMQSRDVYAYRLTSLGRAALKEGRLLEESTDGIARRNAMIDALEDARRNRIERGKKFGVLLIRTGVNGSAVPEGDVAAAIGQNVRRDYSLGRFDARHLVMLMPEANDSSVKAVGGQLTALGGVPQMKVRAVEIADGDSVADALEFAARQLDSNG